MADWCRAWETDHLRSPICYRDAVGVAEVEWDGEKQTLPVCAKHMPKVGNDGLTDAERHENAERWRNGAGRAPSKDEMKELRRLTPVTHVNENPGHVTVLHNGKPVKGDAEVQLRNLLDVVEDNRAHPERRHVRKPRQQGRGPA